MPHMLNNIRRTGFGVSASTVQYSVLLIDTILRCALDKMRDIGVFLLTYLNAPSREEDQNFPSRPQAPCLAPIRHPPSPSQTGDRLTLCSTRLLRPSRHTPDQIRNAPPSSDRWASYQPHRRSLWLFSAHLLPSPSRLQSRGLGRLTAAETRTASGPQALGRDLGLCRPVASQRWSLDHAQTPRTYPPEIRLGRPSSQSRTGFGPTQKKTPVVTPQSHRHRWLRPMIWWPTMKPSAAKSWELRLANNRVQGGSFWFARGWRLGSKPLGHPRPLSLSYRARSPLRRWCWPVCSPN